MEKITVFTPSYNRAYCLHHLYNSLCEQTSKDFIWLIVDDGSIDNTKTLVDKWIQEKLIRIKYIYKVNGGMHTAHNVAYDNITTELNVCIDSDDRMPINAIESILHCWEGVREDSKIVGIVGLDVDLKGNLIGSKLPNNINASKFHLLYQKHSVTGDKKVVLRSKYIEKNLRYAEYEKERLVPLSYLYYKLDRDYDYACFNKIWVEVDYQKDGSSANITDQYFKSPEGFRFAKMNEYENSTVLKYKIRALIHVGFTSMILKDYFFLPKSPNPLMSLLLYPFSLAFYMKSKVSK